MPIEKEKWIEEAAARLYAKCGIAKLATKQDQAWKTKLASDLNGILRRAEFHLADPSVSDLDFVRAVLRVIARVAEFEGIRKSIDL